MLRSQAKVMRMGKFKKFHRMLVVLRHLCCAGVVLISANVCQSGDDSVLLEARKGLENQLSFSGDSHENLLPGVLVAQQIPPAPGIETPGGAFSPSPNSTKQQSSITSRPRFGSPKPSEASLELQSRLVRGRKDADLNLDLQVGRPILLNFAIPPFRVQVADTEIANYLDVTETEFSITGVTEGSTVLTVWFRTGEQPDRVETLSYVVRVFPDPEANRRFEAKLAGLEQEINRAFPDSAVRLTFVGQQVIVRGQARDIEDATQILRVVANNVPGGNNDKAPFDPNSVLAGKNSAGSESDNTSIPGLKSTINSFSALNAGDLVDAGGIEGVLTGNLSTGVNTRLLNSRVINMLEIAGVHQVMLKVTVAEVNRSAARAIGADLSIGEGNRASFFSLLPLATLGAPGTGGTFLVNSGDFRLAINALKTLNLARSLAEPNLVALNGQPAQFQVGGNFPVPVVTGFTAAGLQGVEFVPFGVQLNFLPTVTDGDRIRLRLQATVSTRDESLGTNINANPDGGGGTQVAGLNTRNFNTTVELRDGQTLAIGGLVQTNFGATSNKTPGVGDVPYLGRLFSSDGTSYDEQELIVLVTPCLVAPLNRGVELAIPGSDMFEPSDCEFYLRGSLVGCRNEDFRSPARTDLPKIKAFHRCEQQVIIGQPGHSLKQW